MLEATVLVFGTSISIPYSITCAVIMKMIRSTSATSTNGVTLISASGATVSLGNATLNQGTTSHAWSNQGTITATGSTVNLGGDFTLAGLGNFQPSSDTINLTGVLDDTGTGLALNASTGSWNLTGGTIIGGTYSASDGAELVFTIKGGTLEGVTADSNLDLASINGAAATIEDGLTLAGVSSVIGVFAGAVQGYFGGWLDLTMQRVIEIWSSLPHLYILIILSAILAPSFTVLLVILLLFSWVSLVHLVRA